MFFVKDIRFRNQMPWEPKLENDPALAFLGPKIVCIELNFGKAKTG